MLTLDTGIRPGEAFSLLAGDFNFKSLQVTVRKETAKTRSQRVLPILPATANAVRELILARHPAWKDSVPVFCTTEGRPMKINTWEDRMEMYSKKLGVKIRPYDLRHAFALTYIRNGGYELGLQRTLGHSTLAMTRRYVNLTSTDLREMNGLASPLNTLLSQKAGVRNILKRI